MATIEKIKEDVFHVSWINQSYTTSAQVSLTIKEFFLSCKISYKVPPNTNQTVVEIVFTNVTTSEFRNGPSKITAIKYGVKQKMVNENNIWTTTFPTVHMCCSRGLIFDFIITFTDKTKTLVKTESSLVLERLMDMWETKRQADVTFIFKDESIEAHSLIIASGSPVLAAMFQNNCKEKQEKVVEIKDIDPSVFDNLLRYIYTGDSDWDNVNVADLLIAADKYQVESLKKECAFHLAQDLTVENATQYLVMAHLYNSPDLHQSTLHFMSENAKAICSRKEWMDVIKNYPELSFAAMQLMVMNS